MTSMTPDEIRRSLRAQDVPEHLIERATPSQARVVGGIVPRSKPGEPEHDEQVALCQCGCGKVAPLAPRTDAGRSWVKGRPRRFITGHAHALWRFVNNRGYIALYLPDHPNAGRSGHVGEHVVVAARALGRPLPPKAEVHHFDGDKTNNDGGNLVLCPDHGYHRLLEVRARAYEATGNPDTRKCVRCHHWDQPSNLVKHDGSSLVHQACRRAYRQGRAS